MHQEALHEALNLLSEAIKAMRVKGLWETEGLNITIKLQTQWLDIQRCPWPGCKEGRADHNLWEVSSHTMVVVPEILLHYAEAGHWISYTDMSAKDQKTLISIFIIGYKF